MTFDSSKPDGGAPISQGDDTIRVNQDAVLGALGAEHDFVDGEAAEQTGRHKYPVETSAQLGFLNPAPVEGSIAFSNDERAGYVTLMVYSTGAWRAADVNPNPGNPLLPTLPRLDETHRWLKAQSASWITMGVTPGPPDLVNVDLTASAYQTITVVDTTRFSNPVAQPTVGEGASIMIDLAQDGIGGHTFEFGSAYRAQGGVIEIDTAADSRTMLTFTALVGGEILVTSLPNYFTGGLVAVALVE